MTWDSLCPFDNQSKNRIEINSLNIKNRIEINNSNIIETDNQLFSLEGLMYSNNQFFAQMIILRYLEGQLCGKEAP